MQTDASPASGIGTARPAFVHDARTGVTATPPLATLSPEQFGAQSNWTPEQPAQAVSALFDDKEM